MVICVDRDSDRVMAELTADIGDVVTGLNWMPDLSISSSSTAWLRTELKYALMILTVLGASPEFCFLMINDLIPFLDISSTLFAD